MKLILFLLIIKYLFNCINSQKIVENDKFFAKIKQIRRKNINIPGFNEIFDKFFYTKSEILKLTVKSMHSSKNQVPYSYSFLGLNSPGNVSHPKEGITELLTGKRMSYTNYYVFMNQNETCAWAYTKNFTEKDIKNYKWLIDRKYHITYYLDKLPSGFLTYYKKRIYADQRVPYINYFSGIPIGYKEGKKYHLYNHFVFYVKINEKNNKYQVVDFYISAHSAKQSDDHICVQYEEGDLIYNEEEDNLTYTEKGLSKKNYSYANINISSKDFDIKDFAKKYQNRVYNILEEGTKRYHKIAPEQELKLGNIAFTYDVIFIKSNVSFSSRYDHYISLNGAYRWADLIISNIIILILTFGIFIILKRTVQKDLDTFNTNTIANDTIIDEHGWKQITGDIFRTPRHQIILSAFIGTGIEVFCIIAVSLILSLIGFIKPEIRATMVNYIFICCIVFSIISGYVSTFIYRNIGGKEWLKNCIITALFFPTISLTVLLIIRILMTFEQSSASFKLSQMALLCFLWLFVSSPLVFVGTLLCLMRRTIKYPCKVNALPTTIGEKPWYLHLQYISWFTGIIPFVTFFLEFVYLMKSIWSYQVYYLASFLSLSLLFAIIITSEMSIIYVFINLCYGDHKWWWKSFFVSASPALYVLMYSILYFLRLGLTRLSAIVIYFLINILIAIVVALVLGSCGTLLTFWFVYYIYSKIKID
jgi:transmembrane 9 superfamily protein 2/4